MNPKILIIEDDNEINKMLQLLLSQNGFDSRSAYSGTEALIVHGKDISLILLDLMLPGKSGEEIITELKAKHNVPVIIMSAIHDINKKVDLFSLGADDYVTKPFHNEELIARIKARLRSGIAVSAEEKLQCGNIVIDKNNFTAECLGKAIELSKNEFELLCMLTENSGRTCTKSMIYERIWNNENSADDNTLNVHISKIRKKLKECDSENDYIETVWGIGYRIRKWS